MRVTTLPALLLVLGCGSRAPSVQPVPESWEAVVGQARAELIMVDSVAVDSIDLGSPGLHESRFGARLRNLSHSARQLSLDLRTIPGLWLSAAWQGQSAFQLAPAETLRVSRPYHFRRMSPEAVLRVRFGPAQITGPDGITIETVLAERRFQVGMGNPDAKDPRPSFEHKATAHFDIYARRGSLAQHRMAEIGEEREAGAREIEDLLAVKMQDRVRLVFYPDSASKTSETGHIGEGFAGNGNIVEIYNDSVQLDPYHEVAHIVADRLGNPPAMFNEGFATYVSERLGRPALRYLGHGDESVDRVACRLGARRELIPIGTLFGFTEIGSAESKAEVSYPESASMVKYLIETNGLKRFRELYRSLVASSAPSRIEENARVFERIVGQTVETFESRWLASLSCPPPLTHLERSGTITPAYAPSLPRSVAAARPGSPATQAGSLGAPWSRT